MGTLFYDRSARFFVDDRTLLHLQVVIVDKLRRKESFAFEVVDGDRTATVWINERIALEFRYDGNRRAMLNPFWLDVMAEQTALYGRLVIPPEPPMPEA
jgi:hypothetical protein